METRRKRSKSGKSNSAISQNPFFDDFDTGSFEEEEEEEENFESKESY
ncbi:MAG: hypothetical protein ACREBJ_11705 [Nitrosotalea sp.]